MVKRARKRDRNCRRVELDQPRNYFHHYGPRIPFFFFVLFLSASVNPRWRSLARWYTATKQWKKLSARTVMRPLVDIGGQVRVLVNACMCASVRRWFAVGFDGDDTGVKRGFTSTRSRAEERSDCLEWRFLPRIYSASPAPLSSCSDLAVHTPFVIERSFLFTVD